MIDKILICFPTTIQPAIHDARRTRCAECAGEVWISPKNEPKLDEMPPICIFCVPAVIERTNYPRYLKDQALAEANAAIALIKDSFEIRN